MNLLGIVFDNRELAFLIWGIVALVFILLNKAFRPPFLEIFKILLSGNIVITTIFMFLYVVILVYGLHWITFIDASLIKGTIFWIMFVALPSFFNANEANQETNYFKNYAKNNFKIILILEFLTNLYVFNLFIELLIIPLAIFIGGILGVAETKKEFLNVKKMMDYMLMVLGFASIIYVIYNILNDFNSFSNFENLKSFLLPIILSILFIPAIYLQALFIPAIYLQALFINIESTFLRLNFLCDDKSIKKYAKIKIFFFCNFNLAKAKIISTEVSKFDFSNKKKFNNCFNNFRKMRYNILDK
ncbi:MAG: hypothetical protein H6611_09715 [Ignavibacteriales bacterium]|nr:hypothetical protein [Ignavibacteriales bacterium]